MVEVPTKKKYQPNIVKYIKRKLGFIVNQCSSWNIKKNNNSSRMTQLSEKKKEEASTKQNSPYHRLDMDRGYTFPTLYIL